MIGNMSSDYYNVISNVLEDCKNDQKCNLAFPDLQQRFESFLNTLEENPIHLIAGESEVYLNAAELNAILHQLLYGRNYYSDFPILLE